MCKYCPQSDHLSGIISKPPEQAAFQIPLVDFSRYQHGTAEEQKACVAEIIKGFTTSGFVYLHNSGLEPEDAFKWSERYFALPVDEKKKFPNVNKEANRGCVFLDRSFSNRLLSVGL